MTHTRPSCTAVPAALFGLVVLMALLDVPGACHAQPARRVPDQSSSQRRQLAAQAEVLIEQAAEIRDLQRQMTALSGEVVALRRAARPEATRRQSVTAAVPKTPPTTAGPLLGPSPYEMVLNGSYPGAIGSAADRLKRDPYDAESLALQAYAMIKINQTTQAEPLVTRALALASPNSRARALALAAQGTLADAENQSMAAISAYREANHTDEKLGLPYLAYADHLVKQGQGHLAKTLLQAALQEPMSPNESAAIRQVLARL